MNDCDPEDDEECISKPYSTTKLERDRYRIKRPRYFSVTKGQEIIKMSIPNTLVIMVKGTGGAFWAYKEGPISSLEAAIDEIEEGDFSIVLNMHREGYNVTARYDGLDATQEVLREAKDVEDFYRGFDENTDEDL